MERENVLEGIQKTEFEKLKKELHKEKIGEVVSEDEDKIVIYGNGFDIVIDLYPGNWVLDFYFKEGKMIITKFGQEFSIHNDPKIEIIVSYDEVQETLWVLSKAEYAINEIKSVVEEYNKNGIYGVLSHFKYHYLNF